MDEVRYKPRRDGAGFRIEDTRTKTFLEGEEHDDFVAASQAVWDREKRDAAEELAHKVEAAGFPQLAADLRCGVPRDVLLGRLRERGEGESEAATALGGKEPPK
jgi:hypothetical protein